MMQKSKVPSSYLIANRILLGISVCVAFSTFCWFAFSRLAFTPVPWPDGSAFYLPSFDLLTWPPHWRMHSQAAFVPSYNVANFNMMPLLPLILGVLTRLGLGQVLGAPLAIKIVSLGALIVWAWILWRWLSEHLSKIVAAFVGLAALWDPTIRWGTLVVRSEVWIGLLWILILRELSQVRYDLDENAGLSRVVQSRMSRSYWIVSICLALAAYIHFEAIVLVPATIVGLWKMNEGLLPWVKRLWKVGVRTSLLLVPWMIYVLTHFNLFLEQMYTQFHRLGHGNYWISNPYLFFHSFFLELGSPVGLPKFFNLAKGLFWLVVLILGAWSFYLLWKRSQFRSRSSEIETVLAAATAFLSSLYLWCTKPEVWFLTLCHMMLWSWAGVSCILFQDGLFSRVVRGAPQAARQVLSQGMAHFVPDLIPKLMSKMMPKIMQRLLVFCIGGFALLSFLATLGQQIRTPSSYSWPIYREWVDCIEGVIATAAEKQHPQVWQPHVPDILVELSMRRPDWDLTRTLDFESLRDQALNYAHQADAIVMSRFITGHSPLTEVVRYAGPERPSDRELFEQELEQPFGPWILNLLPQEQPGRWERRICQVGPFFADVSVAVKK